MTKTISMIALLILASMILSVSMAFPVRADTSTASVDRNAITVDLHLKINENITSFLNLGLPNIRLTLDASNSTMYPQISRAISVAIGQKVPGATASLTMSVKSSLIDNSTQTWSLGEDYTINITGATATKGSVASANLSVLSFNMSEPIALGGGELNAVGQAYFLQPLLSFPSTGPAFFINGARYFKHVVPGNETLRFRALDFAWVPPISQWSRSADPLKQSTTYTLDPMTSPVFDFGAPFNLTVYVVSKENVLLRPYYATYDPSIQVTIPAIARAQGSTVYYDLPTSAELFMPSITAASTIVLVATLLLDRRFARARRIVRKKR